MTVLITGESPLYNNLIASFASLGHTIITKSFIETEPLRFQLPEVSCQWIFLSSPRAVDAVLRNGIELSTFKIAVAGKGTKAALPKHVEAKFIARSTAMHEEALRLAATIGKEKIFIPHSTRSNHTFSSVIPENQQVKVLAYTTTPVCHRTFQADIVVFSSPSNAEGYLMGHQPQDNQRFIAFGNTTADYLKKQGLTVFNTLSEVKESALTDAINAAIASF